MASNITLKEVLQSGVSPADIPAAAPPPGVIPDFIHPPSQAYITIITVVVCLTLVVSSVALRIANGLLVTRLRWNDCEFLPRVFNSSLTVEQTFVFWDSYGVSVAKKTARANDFPARWALLCILAQLHHVGNILTAIAI